jgi:hypothetical protein
MNTERLFEITAADMSGNVIEWYVEPAPGKLAYFNARRSSSSTQLVPTTSSSAPRPPGENWSACSVARPWKSRFSRKR